MWRKTGSALPLQPGWHLTCAKSCAWVRVDKLAVTLSSKIRARHPFLSKGYFSRLLRLCPIIGDVSSKARHLEGVRANLVKSLQFFF